MFDKRGAAPGRACGGGAQPASAVAALHMIAPSHTLIKGSDTVALPPHPTTSTQRLQNSIPQVRWGTYEDTMPPGSSGCS